MRRKQRTKQRIMKFQRRNKTQRKSGVHENKKNSSSRKIQPVGSEPSNLGTSILMESNKGELLELLGKESPEGDSG